MRCSTATAAVTALDPSRSSLAVRIGAAFQVDAILALCGLAELRSLSAVWSTRSG